MRRTIGLIAALAIAAGLAPGQTAVAAEVSAPPNALGAGPLPAVRGLLLGQPADVTTSPTPKATWFTDSGATYDIETAHASAAAVGPGAWTREVTDGSEDGRYQVQVQAGQVACVRVRTHTDTDDAEWATDCTVRGRDDSAYDVAGRSRVVASGRFSGGHATRLGASARIEVTGLTAGSLVAATYRRSVEPNDQARWRDPDGRETTAMMGGWSSERILEFPIRAAGTGSFFMGRGGESQALGSVVVIPAWFPLESTRYQPWPYADLADADFSVTARATGHLALRAQMLFTWTHPQSSDLRSQLQLRTGSSTGPAPAWRTVAVPRYATGMRVHVGEGQSLCARARWVRDDGLPGPWTERRCLTRGIDDAHVGSSGRVVSASDPWSLDGRSSRLGGSARLRLGGLPDGSLFGVLLYPEDDPRRAEPHLLRDGRRSSTTWGEGYGGWSLPELRYVPVHRAGTVGTVQVRPRQLTLSVRISAVVCIPRWAR